MIAQEGRWSGVLLNLLFPLRAGERRLGVSSFCTAEPGAGPDRIIFLFAYNGLPIPFLDHQLREGRGLVCPFALCL